MRGIGKFLVQPQEELFAGDFSGKLAHRQIGNLVFRIIPRTFRQSLHQIIHQVFATRTVGGRNHEGAVEGHRLIGGGGKLKQVFALHLVDLVEAEDLLLRNILQAFENGLGVAFKTTFAVDQQQDEIGILRAAPGGGDHGAVEPTARLEDAGRVHENDLRILVNGDAAHHGARRLNLVADDRDLGAHQPVDQRRLAGIGRADKGHETGTGRKVVVFAFNGGVFVIGHDIHQGQRYSTCGLIGPPCARFSTLWRVLSSGWSPSARRLRVPAIWLPPPARPRAWSARHRFPALRREFRQSP
ncbi:hypothetical protein D3C71_874230 [compost metagenome]